MDSATAAGVEIWIFETGQQTTSLGSYQQLTSTASFHAAADGKAGHGRKEQTNKTQMCAYCKGSHSSTNCGIHKDLKSRLALIKQQKLCYNCLAHHCVSQCGSKKCCRKCGSKHHTSICNNSASAIEKQHQQKPDSTTTAILTAFVPPQLTSSTVCLLKTAIATVVGTDLQAEVNVLFDEGSQQSFITEKLAVCYL